MLLARRLLFPAACLSCREDVPAERVEPVCLRCEGSIEPSPPVPTPGGLRRLVAATVFDGPARDLVHGLKYGRKYYLARFMGSAVASAAAASRGRCDLIVPVPLPPVRRMLRGFNPAEALAVEVGRRWGIPVKMAILRRRAGFPSQTALGRVRRLSNARQSFGPGFGAGAVRGRNVLLIDDVSTTGATLAACGHLLRAAGAREIRAAVFAWEPPTEERDS